MPMPIQWLNFLTVFARRMPPRLFALPVLIAVNALSVVGEEPLVRINLLRLPSSQEAQRTLRMEANFFWEQMPLRQGLRELSEVHGITIWLDRGLDPGLPVTLSTRPDDPDRSLRYRLRQIAGSTGADVGLIENVVYFGPRGVPARLQRAAVELHQALSQAAGGAADATLRDLRWGELAKPNEVLRQIERQWRVAVEGQLPHDLMHAGGFLKPATLATQLSVLCGGFDRQVVQIADGTLRLQPLASATAWRAAYDRQELALEQLDSLKRAHPGGTAIIRGGSSLVSGSTDFHLALLDQPPRRQASPTPPGSSGDLRRWTFTVENAPVEAVLEKISVSIGLVLEWDASCTSEHRQKLVSFQVQEASLDALLSAIASAGSMSITRRDQRLEIRAP